jgi:hypothetical protein
MEKDLEILSHFKPVKYSSDEPKETYYSILVNGEIIDFSTDLTYCIMIASGRDNAVVMEMDTKNILYPVPDFENNIKDDISEEDVKVKIKPNIFQRIINKIKSKRNVKEDK